MAFKLQTHTEIDVPTLHAGKSKTPSFIHWSRYGSGASRGAERASHSATERSLSQTLATRAHEFRH